MSAMMFSNDALAKAVGDTLSTMPPEHHNAVVTTVDDKGIEVVAGFKKDTQHGSWQFTGAFQHAWTGDNTVGIKAAVSW